MVGICWQFTTSLSLVALLSAPRFEICKCDFSLTWRCSVVTEFQDPSSGFSSLLGFRNNSPPSRTSTVHTLWGRGPSQHLRQSYICAPQGFRNRALRPIFWWERHSPFRLISEPVIRFPSMKICLFTGLMLFLSCVSCVIYFQQLWKRELKVCAPTSFKWSFQHNIWLVTWFSSIVKNWTKVPILHGDGLYLVHTLPWRFDNTYLISLV